MTLLIVKCIYELYSKTARSPTKHIHDDLIGKEVKEYYSKNNILLLFQLFHSTISM